MNGTVLGRVVIGIAAACLAIIGPTTGTAAADDGCRDIRTSTTGAYFEGTLCHDADLWFISDEYNELLSYLQDTARDGRRAELWVGYTSSGADRELALEATCGVGCWVGAGDVWGWISYPYTGSQVRLRVCTSDAGAARQCGSWQ